MHCLFPAGGVEATATGLPIDGDVLVTGLQPQRQQLGPGPKHGAEGLGVQRREDRQKDVLGRRAVWHLDHGVEPLGVGLTPRLHRLGVVAPADHGHQRDHHHCLQRIT